MHRQGSLCVPEGGLGLTPCDPDLGQSGECLGLKRSIAQTLGFPQRRIGGPQRTVQLPLLAVGDAEIVLRFDDTAVVAGLFVRRNRARVRSNRPAVVALHVGDDAEVVGAPADRGHIVVLQCLFLRPREEVRGFADAAPLQRDGAGHVERPHFQRPIGQHPGPQLGDHGPLLAQVQPTEPAVRDAAQQRQHWGLLELLGRALAQVGEDLGVLPGIGQGLRLVEWRQRPAQLGREGVVPVLIGQAADFAFGAETREDCLGPPRGGLGLGAPTAPLQHQGEVPRRFAQEVRPPMRLGPGDHLAQRALGGRQLSLGREQRRRDP